MSYTPTSWNTGDPITATKLNKMEQGIADAGNNLAVLFAQPAGWSAYGTHGLGFLGYFKQVNNKWTLVSSVYELLWGDNNFTFSQFFPIPPSADIKVFWAIYLPELDEVDLILTGNISQSPITVYNDSSPYEGYELTGTAYADIIMT